MAARVHPLPMQRHGAAAYSHPRSSLHMVHTPTLEPMVDEETEDDDDESESPSAPTTPSTGSTPEDEREPSLAYLSDDSSPSFQVTSSPLTGGLGLLATRPITKGTVIFSEPPLFTQPLSPARTNSTIMAALAKCTREEQRDYFSLWNAHKEKEPGKTGRALLPALGIFETNALPCFSRGAEPRDKEKDDDALGADTNTNTEASREGIFLRAARLNHSCRPNVMGVWDTGAQEMAFRALRDVQAGEELCISYAGVDVLGTRAERAADLADAFGFVCACEACTLDGEEGGESDRRRKAIRRLFAEVGACGKEPTLGMRKIKFALRLLREERLVHYEASFCFDAFQFCVLVSDFANAKAWARKAWESACSTSGPEGSAARILKMYWANPRAHQLAGLLSPVTLSRPD